MENISQSRRRRCQVVVVDELHRTQGGREVSPRPAQGLSSARKAVLERECIRPLPRPQILAGIDTGNTHRRGSQTVLHQVLACITSSRILRVGVLRGAGAQLLLGLVGAKAIQSELVAQCIPLLALYVQARGASGGRQVRDGTVLCRLRCNLRCVLKLKTLRQVCACVTGLIEVNK